MTEHIYFPAYPLNQYISHFTYFKLHQLGHRFDRFLPNGNVEIIIDLTDLPKYIYDNESLKAVQACHRLWISGIRNRFITIPSGQYSEMFIINFHKGMAYSFLGRPLSEITDCVVDGDLILPPVFMQLREQLLEKTSPQQRFFLAEKLLNKSFHNTLQANAFVSFAVNQILMHPQMLTIQEIVRKTGYSAKHLIQLFKKEVGVTPKAFLRIIRFQKAIQEIERQGAVNWVSLACDCGYYDQAHFISDFKSFSGFTPKTYLHRKKGTLNYIPVG